MYLSTCYFERFVADCAIATYHELAQDDLFLGLERAEVAPLIGTLGVAVHTSGTVDETVGLNCDLKRLKAKPQTTKQHQQHALVVF